MRAAAVAALAVLALAAAGCGSSGASSDSSPPDGAASLVPPTATAYASVDLKRDFPGRDLLLSQFAADVKGLGDEVDIAQVEDEAVAFAQPDDVAKLRAVAAKKKYRVEKIGDWYVVADSKDVFDRVRGAESGESLADSASFERAWTKLDGDSVARVWSRSNDLLASARVDGDALRITGTAKPTRKLRVATSPLLRDIPSGSALAVTFHDATDLAKDSPFSRFAPLLHGDGVLYVRPSGLVPQIAIELSTPNPQATLARVNRILRPRFNQPGLIAFVAKISDGKVVIFDATSAADALRSGPKLVDDAAYKDAVGAAKPPAHTALFAYADVATLAPFIELAAEAGLGKPLDPAVGKNLSQVGTVVAWATSSGDLLRFGAWIRPR